MSSILASLDMSLDDIISQKKKPEPRAKTGGTARAKGAQANVASAGPTRGGRGANRRRHQPYARRNAGDDEEMMDVEDDAPSTRKVAAGKRAPKKQDKAKKSSILARLGKAKGSGKGQGQGQDETAGTKILVKNLKYDIQDDEVTELFSTVGKVNKAEIVYDRSGRSKGLARVWFARRADAEKAIKEYDGRTLDGQPMQITLDADKNVRNGLFGTALTGKKDDNVKFNVSLGGRGGQKGRRGRGGRGGGQPKSTEDLDNEMDSYMNDA